MPVKKLKVKSEPARNASASVAGGKLKVGKPVRKTPNTRKVGKSDTSDIQNVRRSGRSESSESSGRRGGLTVDVFDVKGKVVGTVSLPKELFAAKINVPLMAQAVRVYLANQRKGTASTKTRGEVHKTTAKIWRQKGTGRARHGAKSAPIWVGGGVVFGPKPRDYSLTLSKKMRRSALASALTTKAKDQAIKVIDGLEKLEPKTKVMYKALDLATKNNKILLILPEKVESVQRSARNIEGITIRPANLLTTYEVLNSNVLLFMKDAITTLTNVWNKQTS